MERLVALAPHSLAYGPVCRTVVGVDECVASSETQAALAELVRAEAIAMAFPLWQERQARQDGTVVNAVGASRPPSGEPSALDAERRLSGDSWPDDQVVALAIGYLYSYRQVVLLSANRAGDARGLKALLHGDVKPVLNRDTDHALSMVLLLQRPRTSSSGYASRVRGFIENMSFTPGFAEVML